METIIYHSEPATYDEKDMWKIVEQEAERLKENLAMGSFLISDERPDPKIKVAVTAW